MSEYLNTILRSKRSCYVSFFACWLLFCWEDSFATAVIYEFAQSSKAEKKKDNKDCAPL